MRLKKMTKLTALLLSGAMGLSVASASAGTPLRDVPEIDRPMFSVAMAIEISDRCDTINARTLKGLAFLNSLRVKAKDMGYSDAEIKAYVKSDEEKSRMRAIGAEYMRSKGLDPETNEDLCKLGQMEMAAISQIGAFLR